MIIVRLNGGLGNQMFQFAAGYALARRLGVECRVDVSTFQRSIRRYELRCFAEAPTIAHDSDLPLSSRLGRCGMPASLADTLGRALGRTSIFEERSPFVFDSRFLNLPDNSYLIGYFQSEKYFGSAAPEIRKLYTFRDPLSSANKNLLDQIKASSSVSVHVRRGDYISNPHTNRLHGTCSLEYYNSAFRMIGDRLKDICFFVFSDDPPWARENIRPSAETVYVKHNRDETAFEDMRLMLNCRHHIIANSSFSWWAAWLNPSSDKTVIAPRQWIADKNVQIIDLLPDNWIPT